jgi:hypothetical protein
MSRDLEASFYLSVHDLEGCARARDRAVAPGHVYSDKDRLLERSKAVHGEPRYDIPPELEKGQRQRR